MNVCHVHKLEAELGRGRVPSGQRSRGLARSSTRALLATTLLLLAIPSCGADSASPNSTETGNPPLLTSGKIIVESDGDGLVVIGEEGAVEPGRSTVTVSNTSNGEMASVRSNGDGSFELEVDGEPDDSLTLVAESTSTGSSQTLALSQGASDPTLAGCEAICSAPECGASEFAFPVVGCRCDDGGCDCSFDECVEACQRDMSDYRAQSLDCAAMVPKLLGCMESASCELLGTGDIEALLGTPACEGVERIEEECVLGGGVQGCGTFVTEGGRSIAGSAPSSCGTFVQCADANYGYDCHLVDGEMGDYECTCRIDGRATSSARSVSPCVFGAEGWADLALMNFRCGWDLPMGTEYEFGDCQVTDSIPAGNESPECELSAECGDESFSVECVASDDESQVLCSCNVDGEVVFERQLDAQGCAGGADLYDEDTAPSEQSTLRAMNALCEWHLTAGAE